MLKKYNFASLSYTDILFFIALTNTTLWSYVKVVLSRLPLIGIIGKKLAIIFVIILILLCIKKILRILKPIDYIFYIVCFITFISQYLFFPENQFYLDEVLKIFLIHSLPFYFIGRIIDYDKISNFITLLSILSIIIYSIIRFVFNASDDMSDLNESGDMYAAYIIMPFVVLTILDAFKTHNKVSIVISILSFILLLSFGNRGSVLYTLVFVVFCTIHQIKNKSLIQKIFTYMLMAGVLYIFMEVLLENLYTQFEEIGVSTRIFDKLGEDETDTSGRDVILGHLLRELNYAWNGYGITGDRIFLDGTYAHNIFLELLFSFGYFFGALIIIVLLIVLFRAYIKCRNNNNYLFYVALICFGILPLMTSHTFLRYPFFFMLLGYAVQINKSKKSCGNIPYHNVC